MSAYTSKSRSRKAFEVRALSDAEVARYLRQLVTLHKDKRTGNPLLATALQRLAERLDNENVAIPSKEEQASFSFEEFKKFDSDAVSSFVRDETKTKAALIALASSRFAIPPSKLLRMRISEVREAINAAVQHETSLKIIGQEAERQGSVRKS